ncbi:MAG TPA: hypothetical protein VLU95_03895 [Candidatus Acidoferrum sp.]|nr:hypothetical protein [Candidatus Acidoferrum sp.]
MSYQEKTSSKQLTSISVEEVKKGLKSSLERRRRRQSLAEDEI